MNENDWIHKYDSCIDNLSKQQSVPQHGKEYFTVATRHNLFMQYFSNYASINTDIIPELCNDNRVAVKCTIYVNAQTYTGMALEEFGSSFINRTSALENAETSALGRALAAFGLHGTEFASADELINAKMNQNKTTKLKKIPQSSGTEHDDNHVMAIDNIEKDIRNAKTIYELRKLRNYKYRDAFNLAMKNHLRVYRQLDDLYGTKETQLNTQGVV